METIIITAIVAVALLFYDLHKRIERADDDVVYRRIGNRWVKVEL